MSRVGFWFASCDDESTRRGEICTVCGAFEVPGHERCPKCWKEYEWHTRERLLAHALEIARVCGRKHWMAMA